HAWRASKIAATRSRRDPAQLALTVSGGRPACPNPGRVRQGPCARALRGAGGLDRESAERVDVGLCATVSTAAEPHVIVVVFASRATSLTASGREVRSIERWLQVLASEACGEHIRSRSVPRQNTEERMTAAC